MRSMRRQLLRSASDGRLERPGLLELLSEGGPERREARRGHKQRRRRAERFRVVKMSADEKIDLLFEKLSGLEEETSELWSKLRELEARQ